MKKLISGSIRKRLFVSMLAFSMLVVCFITGIAVRSTYHTMREQLIYNRRMSIGWLQDRMELEADSYQDRFYEFEVDRSIRETIESWCLKGKEPDYADQWKLITMMNEVISMDSNLNSIELYNLPGDEVLQSNLVFMCSEKDIQVVHRIHRFSDKLLLIVTDNGVGIKKEHLSELQKKLEHSNTLAMKAGAHIGLQKRISG